MHYSIAFEGSKRKIVDQEASDGRASQNGFQFLRGLYGGYISDLPTNARKSEYQIMKILASDNFLWKSMQFHANTAKSIAS